MINSRAIAELLPRVQTKAINFIAACRKAGIELIVTSTYRDAQSQDALYAQGRTTPGKIVTNVAGGDSMHQHRVAFDVVPIVNGKCCWDDRALWSQVGKIGQQCGLEWGGAWKSFVDRPHFQDTGGLTLAQLKSATAPTNTAQAAVNIGVKKC
jgi:peptidoglycan L-alanyl-D-glutamate endopeptidase CwlK